MPRTTLTTAGASLWAVLGGSVSLAGLTNVNDDAVLLVALATPTYFAYPLNVVVLAAGLWLTASSTVQGRRRPEPA